MACSGKPCRQSANLTPVPCSSTSRRPADQWRSERRRDPCTFRLGCHAPLCLTADAERLPAEEIMSIGGAHGARRGTGPSYLDCPLSRGALYLILQNRISRGSGSPEIRRIVAVADKRGRLTAATPAKTRGIERAPRDHSPTGDRREKRLFRHF